jgi:hypothetical protein
MLPSQGEVMPRVFIAAVALLLVSLVSAARAQVPTACACGWSGYYPPQWGQGIPPGFSATAWGQGLPWGYTPTTWRPAPFAALGCGSEMMPSVGIVPGPAPAPAPPPVTETIPPPKPVDPEKSK